MSTREMLPVRRILLALDAGVEMTGFLEAMTAAALALDAELDALFVEDVNLLRLAGLPFARELGLTSSQPRRLQNPAMERMLKSQARRAQALLATIAERASVRWRFHVARGQMITALTEAAVQTDLLTLPLVDDPAMRQHTRRMIRQMAASAACPVLVLPAGAELAPPYAVIFDGSAAARRAVRLAAQLARQAGLSFVVVGLLPSEESARWQEDIDTILSGEKLSARIHPLASRRADAVLRLLRFEGAATLLLPLPDDPSADLVAFPDTLPVATLLVP